MTNFTHNNHLVYSTGDNEYGHRSNSFEKFSVRLGKVDHDQYRSSSYRQELYRTADIVYKEFGNDLVVLLSGGTDSEIVLRNFVDIGVRPRCVAIKFAGDYNLGDINEAYAITNELGIKLDTIEFDIKEFYYSGEAADFGSKIQCTQLAYLMSYYNIAKLSAPAVMGGEVFLSRNVSVGNDNYWSYVFRENEDASAMRFSLLYGIPLVNEWFSYTPELLLYYLENPMITSLISTKYNYKLTSVSSKNKILKTLYPEIRDKIKTHGFEQLRAFNHESYRQIASTQISRLESSLDGIPYFTALRMLKGE